METQVVTLASLRAVPGHLVGGAFKRKMSPGPPKLQVLGRLGTEDHERRRGACQPASAPASPRQSWFQPATPRRAGSHT